MQFQRRRPKLFKNMSPERAVLLLISSAIAAGFGACNLLPNQTSHDTVSPGDLQGVVISIADGDTITIRDHRHKTYRVRFLGIDAPESKQPGGPASHKNLQRYLEEQTVVISNPKPDRYERNVGKVLRQSTECLNNQTVRAESCPFEFDVGLAQVRDGQAWWYEQYARDQTPADRERYRLAEEEARDKRLGLWQARQPEPPWQWRRKQRQQSGH